jgi:hypothetical protein
MHAVDDQMALKNPRTAALENVGPEPPAFRRGGNFLQRIPRRAHILHSLFFAPFAHGVIVDERDVRDGELGKP